jgi:hypothetical protein
MLGDNDTVSVAVASDIGSQRCLSMSAFDSPIFLPPDPVWAADIRALVKKQITENEDIEVLLRGYVELLVRAKSFVDFWKHNVGPTDDWPISVFGETDEAEDCLTKRFNKLNSVVNFMEESSCS